jgi:hypothetical protein
MANDEKVPWWLWGLGALGGGILLASMLADEEDDSSALPTGGDCYNCGRFVAFQTPYCPYCGVAIQWTIVENG